VLSSSWCATFFPFLSPFRFLYYMLIGTILRHTIIFLVCNGIDWSVLLKYSADLSWCRFGVCLVYSRLVGCRSVLESYPRVVGSKTNDERASGDYEPDDGSAIHGMSW
jgi:uncharacterized membrane protein